MTTSGRVRLALGVAGIAAWVGVAAAAGTAAPSPAVAQEGGAGQGAALKGDPAQGKILWTKVGCYTCHGYVGQGGAGARLAPPGTPSLPAFTRYARRPTGQMPPFTEPMVSDQDLAHMHAYLMSLPQPPDISTIPLLQGGN